MARRNLRVPLGFDGLLEFFQIFQQGLAIRIGQDFGLRRWKGERGTDKRTGTFMGPRLGRIPNAGQGGRKIIFRPARPCGVDRFRAWIFAIPAHDGGRHPPFP